MKNAINYYYNIYVSDLINKDKKYQFYLNNEEYHFIPYDRPFEDIVPLYKLNQEMLRNNILTHEIILNNNKEIVTFVNNIPYILLKYCGYKNEKVFINDIKYYQNFTTNINSDKELLRTDWVNMWCDKIDYYEYQISELGKKYPILLDSLSYYIGLGENAISFYINNKNKYQDAQNLVVSHKRIKIDDGSKEFYNPLNFIVDNRMRDITEYIKNSFFSDNLNNYEINLYLQNSNLNSAEYVELFSRLLFPTYYFDIYDEIINNNLPEEKIIDIIQKNDEYELFLKDMYTFITNKKNIFLDPIEWLLKR